MPTLPPYVIAVENGRCPKQHITCGKKKSEGNSKKGIFIAGLTSYTLDVKGVAGNIVKQNSRASFNVTKLEDGYQIDYKASYSCVNLPSARPEGNPTYGKTYTGNWEIESTPNGQYQPYIITNAEIEEFSSPGMLSSNFYTDPLGVIDLPATLNLAPVGIIVYVGGNRKEVEEDLKGYQEDTEETKAVVEIIYSEEASLVLYAKTFESSSYKDSSKNKYQSSVSIDWNVSEVNGETLVTYTYTTSSSGTKPSDNFSESGTSESPMRFAAPTVTKETIDQILQLSKTGKPDRNLYLHVSNNGADISIPMAFDTKYAEDAKTVVKILEDYLNGEVNHSSPEDEYKVVYSLISDKKESDDKPECCVSCCKVAELFARALMQAMDISEEDLK